MTARLADLKSYVAALLIAAMTVATSAQQAPAPSQPPAVPSSPGADASTHVVRQPSTSERRKAAKLYLGAAKLYTEQQFEKAMEDYELAAKLDPTNPDYAMAASLARSHAVTALIQTAARERTAGNTAGARAALTRAMQLDPQNPFVAEHLRGLADDVIGSEADAAQPAPQFGESEQLEPSTARHSFHLRNSQRQIIQQVFRAYGIDSTIDDSVRGNLARLDLDDSTFPEAARAVGLLTDSFYVPIDAHRALVARDTRELRQQYTRNAVETVYLAGMSPTEMTDMGNMAKNVFNVSQSAVNPTAGTLTLRGSPSTLNAFNATFSNLSEGKSEVLLEVKLYQLTHTSTRNTGLQPPQTVTAFNVYAEEQSILNSNQALVQQIISSGLAAPGDTLTILGLLLASGQVSSSLFAGGIATFGGGITQSAISPSPATINFSLNTSDSRQLDDFQLRLQDGQDGTLKSGMRYPIMTSSFSSLGANSLNIPGLSSAGSSSSLSSLASSLAGASTTIPQVQYEDLGLTLKTTPRLMRSGDVAVNIDMKITALAGSSLNGVPALSNQAFSGVITVRENQAAVLASEIDESQNRALSGYPGITEIPGLNNITDKIIGNNNSQLVIIITPHVVRSPHGFGHSPMVPIERSIQAQ